jgi:hypothetical protein
MARAPPGNAAPAAVAAAQRSCFRAAARRRARHTLGAKVYSLSSFEPGVPGAAAPGRLMTCVSAVPAVPRQANCAALRLAASAGPGWRPRPAAPTWWRLICSCGMAQLQPGPPYCAAWRSRGLPAAGPGRGHARARATAFAGAATPAGGPGSHRRRARALCGPPAAAKHRHARMSLARAAAPQLHGLPGGRCSRCLFCGLTACPTSRGHRCPSRCVGRAWPLRPSWTARGVTWTPSRTCLLGF